ncbi:MAG: class I SAM-dependent methyltransferase, partial [Candidatus Lokiarchaeota archaeon]
MAVVYMKKLEEEPQSYDSAFTLLTKGVNRKVQDWVLGRIQQNNMILEVGCGTGTLAKKVALKGNSVKAIDKNVRMIKHAIESYPNEKDVDLLYQIGSYENLDVENNSQDLILSTFMLSELGPFEQQIFLRNAWSALKPNGRLIIAAEFIPSGIWKIHFKLKRWWFKKKIRKLKLEGTHINENFLYFTNSIGFKILSE